MQETSWFILPASLPGKHYSVTSKRHTEKTADYYHPPLFESRVSRCDKMARKRNEDRRWALTHINYFTCPYHHHPNFKNCFWATLTFESKHFRKVYYKCRKMHKSHPLFTKWTHPCNQRQTEKQMLPASQEALSCVFQALSSAHINFLKRTFTNISLNYTVKENRNYHWPCFTNKDDFKAQKIWSDLPKVAATRTSAFKFHCISITLHRHCVAVIVIH